MLDLLLQSKRNSVGIAGFPFVPAGISPLRIASLNVHSGRNVSAIASEIASNPNLCSAHILFLQEVESHESEDLPRAERIAKTCGFECIYSPARATRSGGTHGLAILSKIPLSDAETMQLERCKLVFNTRSRVASVASIIIGTETVRLYNVHLDTRINARDRLRQLEPVLRDAAAFPGKAIIAGDFNTVPIRWAGRVLPVSFSNQRKLLDAAIRARGFSDCVSKGFTMKSGPLRFRLDSIYSRGFSVRASGIERASRISDHFPLWAEIVPE